MSRSRPSHRVAGRPNHARCETTRRPSSSTCPYPPVFFAGFFFGGAFLPGAFLVAGAFFLAGAFLAGDVSEVLPAGPCLAPAALRAPPAEIAVISIRE